MSTRAWEGIAIPESGTFDLDAAHSIVGFTAKHMMVTKVRGRFQDFTGSVTIAENPLESSAELTIRTASIDTGSTDRDNHLRSEDFLAVDKFPELTFRSARVVEHSGDDFTVVGDLTIRDVTKQVTLKVEYGGAGTNPWGAEVFGFSIETEIDREDFGLTWNVALETGGVLVSKKVKIEVEGQATRRA
ncbi:polyisoprenoid-binding protein [Sphaerisporangium krabiense]|uniref:Polyisoprenoid-binding protein YceI n=1 Tax=Sphaerisporangium krabiense TaxID=763782 RepID=A0A7W8Z366_9ACTN|nr:YceI family protein [Sphaerisporangium krabiense]MBB5626561.1 polyisoprenoid-binding protein YceI [Sphaerisporangium krabiense]GII63481.1 polyisoprenoid-binding protein [Sphaerisporangium krabiense]